jgi:hypothetical protein
MPSNPEILITHSQAACIFYDDTLTTENEILNEAKIAAIQDVELCYIDTPSEPYLLASKSVVFTSLNTYYSYETT